MSLYHKYRPKTLDEIYGNTTTISMLKADFAKEDKPHAILLHGPTGTGKTTIGRILANMLGCKDSDFRELDITDLRGIDVVRSIRQQSQYKPVHGDCIVWLLDEVHRCTSDAQAALLKALEDTPSHVYYILATTDPQKLLSTIRGRCSQYTTQVLTDTDMYKLLRQIVRSEQQALEKEIYDQIILDSQGHPRNALQILDQVLAVDESLRFETAKKTAEVQNQIIDLCRSLMSKSSWKRVSQILSGLKEEDPEKIRRSVLGYCNSVLLKGENDLAAIIMDEFIEPTYNAGWPMITWACYKIAKN